MKNRAQSTLEYAVIIAVAVAALIAMSAYMKRSVQGKLRLDADRISEGAFYSPGAANSNSTITRSVQENSESYSVLNDGATDSNDKVNITETGINSQQVTNRSENILPFASEPARW